MVEIELGENFGHASHAATILDASSMIHGQ
jgi:hypothetical protein